MVYILGDSTIKHVNGRNVSVYMKAKVRSHPGATTEDLTDYVKPMAHKKKQKCWCTRGQKRSTEWYEYHQ